MLMALNCFMIYFLFTIFFQCRKVFSFQTILLHIELASSHRLHRFAVVVQRCSMDSVTKVIRWKLIIWKTLTVIRISKDSLCFGFNFVWIYKSIKSMAWILNVWATLRSVHPTDSWTIFLDILSCSLRVCLYYYLEWCRDWLQSTCTCACAQYSTSTWLNTAPDLIYIILPWMVYNLQCYKPNCQPMLVHHSPFVVVINVVIPKYSRCNNISIFESFYVKLFLSHATEVKRNCSADIHYYNVLCIETFDWNLSWLPILILM